MADKNIMFKEAEGHLKATIDNQTLDLEVLEIIKQPTHIVLNKENIDTTLTEAIEFGGMIDTVDSVRDLLRSGILYITIQDENLNNLIETTTTFENRLFDVSIPNSLPTGDYYCRINYLESKYFLACEYVIKFKVKKRAIGYKFDKSAYIGYRNEKMTVQMYLYDYKTKLPVETNVLYKFNGEEFLGRTNRDGYINMNIKIPDAVKEECKSFMEEYMPEVPQEEDIDNHYYTIDTKGWVYQNGQLIQWFDSAYHYYVGELGITVTKRDENEEEISDINKERYYTLEIYIQSDIYEIYPISVRIYVRKSPTTINWEESRKVGDKIRIMGNVEAVYGNVTYGAIILEVQDELEKIKFCVNEYGEFDYCFDPITAMINSTNGLDKYITGIGNTKKVSTQIECEIDRGEVINIINDGQYGRTYLYDVRDDTLFKATAKVTTLKNDQLYPVTEGMVCFIIYRLRYDGIWVRNYRYSEEINEDGEASILFDLSKEGRFYIYAEYYGMFEYRDSTSSRRRYKVINDANTVKFNKKDALKLDLDWHLDISITDDERNGNDRRLLLDIDNWYDTEIHTEIPKTFEFDVETSIDDIELENDEKIKSIRCDADIKEIKLKVNEPDIEVTQEKDNG